MGTGPASTSFLWVCFSKREDIALYTPEPGTADGVVLRGTEKEEGVKGSLGPGSSSPQWGTRLVANLLPQVERKEWTHLLDKPQLRGTHRHGPLLPPLTLLPAPHGQCPNPRCHLSDSL